MTASVWEDIMTPILHGPFGVDEALLPPQSQILPLLGT